MAQPVLPSPDNVIAVALVINTKDGISLVFHYPPEAPVDGVGSPSNKSPDDMFDPDDIILERLLSQPSNSLSHQPFPHKRNDNEHLITDTGTQLVPWEYIAGYPTKDLASLLSPGRPYHKKLFQVSLDNLYFISCPVYVPENGIWKKKKKAGKSKAKQDSLVPPSETDTIARNGSDQPLSARGGPTGGTAGDAGDGEKEKEKEKEKEREKEREKEKEDKISPLSMFNVVFMLTPKRHEVRELVNALHLNIIKRVNKVFKYSQQLSDFVWKESKRIQALKEKAREDRTPMSELWKEILKSHTMAISIKEIYDSLTQNRIGTLQLETTMGPLNLSMQIPVPFYVADLPPESDERLRGLWLTTANTYISEEALEDVDFLDKNFALLLLDSEKKIISQLQADSDPSALPMVKFVQLCKPTMSLYQIGQSNSVLSHGQVRKYAQHFIFWRRAIAIPPLHGRDVYIMSPNCHLSRLPQASQEWARLFQYAPPLTNFLAELSYAPRPYKNFYPSKPHRPEYMEMLAWLMRNGWVTQLCTFAYVVVWPEIIYEVEYAMEAEELSREKSAAAEAGDANNPATASSDPDPASSSESTSTSSLPSSGAPPTAAERIAEAARLDRLKAKLQRAAADKATAHARKSVPTRTDHPSTNDAPHLSSITPHVILDAKKATGKDSRYLSAIGERFGDDKTRKAWMRFWRYFDGQYALERVALQEDMKRKEAWNLLTAMSEYLLCVRHW